MLTTDTPLKKSAFLWKASPSRTKLLHKIALGVGVLCLLLIVLAANAVINGAITRIPILRMTVGETEMRAMEEDAAYVLDKLNEAIEEDDDDVIDELENEYDLPVKEIQNAFDPLSISSISEVGPALTGDDDMYDLFDAVTAVVIGYAVVIALLTVLAVLRCSTALTVFAYVISIPYYVFLSGTLYLILATVAFIALTVLLKKLNSDYKAYKNSFSN